MGLFSGHRRLIRPSEFRSPIRVHSELSLEVLAARLANAGRRLRRLAVLATNDARVVGALLLVASALLAAEMTRSIVRP